MPSTADEARVFSVFLCVLCGFVRVRPRGKPQRAQRNTENRKPETPLSPKG